VFEGKCDARDDILAGASGHPSLFSDDGDGDIGRDGGDDGQLGNALCKVVIRGWWIQTVARHPPLLESLSIGDIHWLRQWPATLTALALDHRFFRSNTARLAAAAAAAGERNAIDCAAQWAELPLRDLSLDIPNADNSEELPDWVMSAPMTQLERLCLNFSVSRRALAHLRSPRCRRRRQFSRALAHLSPCANVTGGHGLLAASPRCPIFFFFTQQHRSIPSPGNHRRVPDWIGAMRALTSLEISTLSDTCCPFLDRFAEIVQHTPSAFPALRRFHVSSCTLNVLECFTTPKRARIRATRYFSVRVSRRRRIPHRPIPSVCANVRARTRRSNDASTKKSKVAREGTDDEKRGRAAKNDPHSVVCAAWITTQPLGDRACVIATIRLALSSSSPPPSSPSPSSPSPSSRNDADTTSSGPLHFAVPLHHACTRFRVGVSHPAMAHFVRGGCEITLDSTAGQRSSPTGSVTDPDTAVRYRSRLHHKGARTPSHRAAPSPESLPSAYHDARLDHPPACFCRAAHITRWRKKAREVRYRDRGLRSHYHTSEDGDLYVLPEVLRRFAVAYPDAPN
jgi:hypothetical protein